MAEHGRNNFLNSRRSPIAPGEQLAGKYRIGHELGAGSMGVVVKGFHIDLDQPVAIKFLFPEYAQQSEGSERFRREARCAARIQSEHVAQVLDVGSYGDPAVPYIVMEHLEGCDLASRLANSGRLFADEAIGLVLDACEAIEEAHLHGIIHRDLKPANLFLHHRVGKAPYVKVLDFGISKVTDPSGSQFSLTGTSMLMGTPSYMSPEQLESTRDVDQRTDIWSLGVILHELIVGSTPFEGKSIPQLVRSILAGKRSLLTDSDPSLSNLEKVVARCLKLDREERFVSVSEVSEALRLCVKSSKQLKRRRELLRGNTNELGSVQGYASGHRSRKFELDLGTGKENGSIGLAHNTFSLAPSARGHSGDSDRSPWGSLAGVLFAMLGLAAGIYYFAEPTAVPPPLPSPVRRVQLAQPDHRPLRPVFLPPIFPQSQSSNLPSEPESKGVTFEPSENTSVRNFSIQIKEEELAAAVTKSKSLKHSLVPHTVLEPQVKSAADSVAETSGTAARRHRAKNTGVIPDWGGRR